MINEYVSLVLILVATIGIPFYLISKFGDDRNRRRRELVSDSLIEEIRTKKNVAVELTREQLKFFDGIIIDIILISLKGVIYNTTSAPEFYGEDGGYHVYAGKESGRALGKMTLGKPQHDEDLENPWVDDLTPEQNKVLDDWIKLFKRKYPVVGSMKKNVVSLSSTSSKKNN
jgi:membrane-associated progesterone receptor component